MDDTPAAPADRTPPDDPILARRDAWRRFASTGQRIGYLVFAVSIVTFFVGLSVGWSDLITTVVIGGIIVGSFVLAPAIVFGYAVKAADRADRDGDW